jgi:Protein of unknown function (DUF3443)
LTPSASIRRAVAGSALLILVGLYAGCGGSSSHQNSTTTTPTIPPASGNNVQPIMVNGGPANNYANGVFTTITVCVPSSSTCQTIDGILVDTGSYGLRLLSSAGGGALTLSLPTQTASNGDPIGECAQFVSSYTWGPVKTADITISGEHAGDVPVQVIDPTFASVPSGCAKTGLTASNTLQTLAANGILGIGPFTEDCGGACAQTGSSNPGMYYDCASMSCQVIAQPVAQQVQNPVALFPADNNGVILEFPALSGTAASLSGSMVFGIGTQSNNALANVQVFPVRNNGDFTTNFKGKSYSAFVDSGSNALFFLDSATTGLPTCPDSSSFYCPSSTQNLSAVTGSGTPTTTVNFSVANADSLFSNRTAFVFPTLAGPNPGTFDWGLPFFFGRNVYTAIAARSTPAGVGPFWAY